MNRISKITRSAKPELLKGLPEKIKDDFWITPSKLRNYIVNDPFSDLAKEIIKPPYEGSIFASQGCKFEDNVCNVIEERFPGDTIRFDRYDQFEEAKNAILQNIPIIFQAPLKDDKKRLRGIADILVKGNYIPRIFTGYTEEIEFPDNYYVVDIKFKTLYVKKDGELSNQADFKTYKAQTCIYTDLLSKIQGVRPSYSFIMGRGIKGGIMDPFHTLAKVNNEDEDLQQLVKDAIKHYKHIKNNYENYDLYDLPIQYLPNTAVTSYSKIIDKLKVEVIQNNITKLPFCGIKHREYTSNMNWNDENLKVQDLGMNEKRTDYLQRLIDVNKSEDKLYDSTIGECRLELDDALFLDFETIPNIVETDPLKQDQTITDFTFMIGFTHHDEFMCYTTKKYNLSAERKIFKRFLRYCDRNEFSKIVFYYADKQFFNRLVDRHSPHLKEKYTRIIREIDMKWFDLHRYLKDNEFVVKGLFDLKLKNVVKALGLPDYEEELQSGKEAFEIAIRHYTEEPNKAGMRTIKTYNKLDCESLYNIYKFLKS